MTTQSQTGVFLCKCGNKIEPVVDLGAVQEQLSANPDVAHCDILSYPCIKPGLEQITQAVGDKGLNRMIIAGCESRLMLKKLANVFQPLGFHKEQIVMVNLRDHVAAVSSLSSQENAVKGAKLIQAAVAEMAVLAPTIQTLAQISEPVLIVGGGIASFAAAKELHDNKCDFIMVASEIDPVKVVGNLHLTYPGERAYYDRLHQIVKKVTTSRYGTFLTDRDLIALSGVTGDYTLTFQHHRNASTEKIQAGAIIVCIMHN